MGLLVPDDFDLSTLINDAEQQVVEALRDQLSDDWLVLPDVGIAEARDRQMDVVIVHPRDGIAVIEVKGHRVDLRGGTFYAHGQPMQPQPDKQAHDNAYALRNLLRSRIPALASLHVEYAIAFPNTTSIRGNLPPNLMFQQVLTGAALGSMGETVDRLMTYRWGNQAIGDAGVAAIIEVLRPDAAFERDADTIARRARRRMDELCTQRVRALEHLDVNRRVFVTGSAGTGKTRLAMRWAQRAVGRGERVLLTCFNDPLATELRARMDPSEHLTIGSFFEVAFALDGMAPLERPDDADADWWDLVAVGHLIRHWPSVTERFDVLIVDEAQDFSPAWLAMLSQLLDQHGDRRVLMLADAAQGVFARGFVTPTADEGWTRCELEDNCRNTFGIASILHRRFEGGRPLAGPESLDVHWCQAEGTEELAERVGEAIDQVEDDGYSISQILIATTTRTVRDPLRAALGLGTWEQRGAHTIVCENVQRMKGLEFDVVVLAAEDDVTDLLLYVGLSRAVSSFTLVAPRSVAARLGIADDPAP